MSEKISRTLLTLDSVDELIVNNLDAYCFAESEKVLLQYPKGLEYLESLAYESKYDATLFLSIPTELLSSAISLLIFKKPLTKWSLVNLFFIVIHRRLLYLLLVNFIPWKRARINGLLYRIGKSIAAKNKVMNKVMRYIYYKIKNV